MDPPGWIEVDVQPEQSVIRLFGEHDMQTGPELASALGQALRRPRVLVDLRECTYIDTTLVTAVISAAQKLADQNGEIGLIAPAGRNSVRRVLELTDLVDLIRVPHEDPPRAT